MNAMTEKCFEIGTIQAFLDGELENDSLAQVAHHVAVCGDCAMLLAEAESESAFAFAALDSELNSLVPTSRIRANLYEQIAAEKKSFWQKIFGENFSFTNSSTAAFASLILVAGIFATLFIIRENRAPVINETAKINLPKPSETQEIKEQKSSAPDLVNGAADNFSSGKNLLRIGKSVVKTGSENRAAIQKADNRRQKFVIKNQPAQVENKNVDVAESPVKNQGLIGEDGYLKTIATLNSTVNNRKDEALKPSERVSFEKDLAVVDDSISKMQKEVRSNPKNEAARELLRSAYQNKIDLLNSVADKSELMALK